MRLLFLQGRPSTPGGVTPAYLEDHGHEVLAPTLPDDFDEAVAVAQATFEEWKPDIILGSDWGGAVAMNLAIGETPLILLSPAWKGRGKARTIMPSSLILHSRSDQVVPFADSEELAMKSGLPPESLIDTDCERWLADDEALKKMLEEVERKAVQEATERKLILEAIHQMHLRKLASRPTTPEIGVPRRFGVGVLMIITAMYAALFAVLHTFGFSPVAFGIVVLFFTTVGLGQMLLFKGQRPRKASVLVGACFFPGFYLTVLVYRAIFPVGPSPRVAGDFCGGLPCIVLAGALMGYLAGILIAGVFLIADKIQQSRSKPVE